MSKRKKHKQAKELKHPKTHSVSSSARRRTPPTKPKNAAVRKREYLTPQEVKKLKKAALESARHGFRDWLLITMIYRHALRVSELAKLRWKQIDLQQGTIRIERMKNGDTSIHFLEDDEIEALLELQEIYLSDEHVFSSQRQGPLTPRTIHYIIAKAGECAGLEVTVHPHMLRHSKGFQLANRGEDARTIQLYFGHKNIQNSAVYMQSVDPKRLKGLGRD